MFVILFSFHPGVPSRPFTPKVLWAKKHALIPYSSVVFTLNLYLNLSRSLGACHSPYVICYFRLYYCRLFGVILLVAIVGHSIGGYCWSFHWWLLLIISLVAIGTYLIGVYKFYWWLLVVFLLVAINGYFINGYW